MKIVADARYGEILGAHIVGNRACDMISELVDTMALEGGYQELARIVHPHPTILRGRARRRPRGRWLGDPSVATVPFFFYDLGSPYAYLAAERVNALFAESRGEPPQWQPILLGGLFKRFGRDSWARGEGRDQGMREVERRASAYGLPPIKWPEPFPGNTLLAMRAADLRKGDRSRRFFLAGGLPPGLRGRPRPDRARQRVARRRCRGDAPSRRALGDRAGVGQAHPPRGDRAAGDLGVRGVPSIAVGGQIFWGDDRLEEAVALS